MKLRNYLIVTGLSFLFVSSTFAQRTEIAIGLSEHFFDTVVDALFQAGGPLEFSIAGDLNRRDAETRRNALSVDSEYVLASMGPMPANTDSSNNSCRESIRLQRESGGVRTAVRFRDRKIIAPLAFNGSYNPPFVGCVDFSGWAETAIDLEFDQSNQRLIARARVLNVSINGTGGVGGNIIARMVQNAIDKKINPIEIIRLDKLSFMLPIQNSANLEMRAVGVRHEIKDAVLVVQIAYEFAKAG